MIKPIGLILPITYLSPVSYFCCLTSGYPVLIETGETFPKQTLRNRCEIADSNGKQILVIPVHKPGGNRTKTSEVLISTHQDWRTKHWRAIETAYSSSPFYLYYSDRLKELIFQEAHSLQDYTIFLIEKLSEMIGIDKQFEYSQGYLKESGDFLDLRGAFSKKGFPGDIEYTPYQQVFSHRLGFLENLSILDLVFNLGPESLSYLQKSSASFKASF